MNQFIQYLSFLNVIADMSMGMSERTHTSDVKPPNVSAWSEGPG